MAWFRRADPVIQSVLADLAKVGCQVDTLEAVGEIDNPSYEVLQTLERWSRQVPPKYTQRFTRVLHHVRQHRLPKPTASQKNTPLAQLIDAYKSTNPIRGTGTTTSAWHIGDEIYQKYSDRHFDAVAELIQDPRYGLDRQMLALALGKSKRPEAVDVLLSVLDEYGISGHATEALAKLRSERARAGLTRMLDDDREWVRTQARKGLARLDEPG